MRLSLFPTFSLSIIVLNFFLSSSAIGGSIYENSLKNYIKNDLKKFLFKSKDYNVKPLIAIDDKNNLIEINTERKVLVINFWATWCSPCKKEMPSLNSLAKKLNRNEVEIVTIASGRNSISHIENFFLKNKITNLKKYRDPLGKTAISYKIVGLPTTIIISPKGEEIGRLLGDINWEKDEVYQFFNALIKIGKN
mgnify:CR=1 FL=1|tara:strand:+ start:558 stop:1139 length:582 start_codon:yes stop_codon:yes gene_type:complete